MAAFESLGSVPRKPRPNSTLGWLGAYDANVIGGLLLGIGLATTGACPGTVLAQIATGVQSGPYVALGGLLGGILYSRLGVFLKRRSPPPKSPNGTEMGERHYTLPAKFKWNINNFLLVYEVVCLVVIGATSYLDTKVASRAPHLILGGFLIGGAQAASLLLTGQPVGVSTAYEQVGQYFWHLFTLMKSRVASPPPAFAIQFALGLLAGSSIIARYLSIADVSSDISKSTAIAGGVVMIVGARLAGGCTSGHGISGMSMFAISSVVTVAAMFAGGIATSLLI